MWGNWYNRFWLYLSEAGLIPVAKPDAEERCPTSTPDDVTLGFAVLNVVAGKWSSEAVRAALLTTLL